MAKEKPKLIIVESPTKARTISRFVGQDYIVKSSYGHIRDLPQRDLGIDIEKNFEPKYVIPKKAQKVVKELRAVAKKTGVVILATDEDREGEAIAWHLVEALKLEVPKSAKKRRAVASEEKLVSEPQQVLRIVFHEITKKAIADALGNPRTLDIHRVDAQQARRVLDRLVGYKLSPLLWKKISKGLSAGRVQSVALRLVVEREREREAFKAQEYWTIEALLAQPSAASSQQLAKGSKKQEAEGGELEGSQIPPGAFWTRLAKIGEKTVKKLDIKNEKFAKKVVDDLSGAEWRIAKITQNDISRPALAPFTTSTLQQAASRRLGFSARQTMMLAQQLYEGIDVGEEGSTGLITYMRTDSVNLSEESLRATKDFLQKEYGDAYAEGAPRIYKTKSRLAQEAHEAIRPTDVSRTPESLRSFLEQRQWKLYDLVWRRFVASQMPPAIFRETDVEVSAGPATNSTDSGSPRGTQGVTKLPATPLGTGGTSKYLFEVRGLVKVFDGHLRVYAVKTQEVLLPALVANDTLALLQLLPKIHHTEPPPRFNEASLVKTLEEYDIGRPSTYAPIMSTIQDRGYVAKDEKRYFFPTDIGKAVNDLLVEHFPEIVDVKFTATMEEDLDKIASGDMAWVAVIREFYDPFSKHLAEKHETIEKLVEETKEVCEKCGKPMIIRWGRYGKFLACSGFPDCKNAKPLPGSEEEKQSAKLDAEIIDEKCETCGAPLVRRRGRFGPFLGCSKYPECKYIKKKDYRIGIKCPKCSEGDIVSRRSKNRRIFYGCSRYPACDYATWTRPAEDETRPEGRPGTEGKAKKKTEEKADATAAEEKEEKAEV